MIARQRLVALSISTLCVVAAPLAAQQTTTSTASTANAGASAAASAANADHRPAGPTVGAAIVGVREAAPAPLPAPDPRRADTSQNRALMIVGGAALLVGAIIGSGAGLLIMVGGAVVGLWGLYQYVQ